MRVYRITVSKWANTLQASGYAGRWNSNGIYMLYTSSTIALASLENLVHRSGEGLNKNFKIIEINIPSSLTIDEIKMNELPMKWFDYKNYSICQEIGDDWIADFKTPVLKVPSAIIKKETNYLLNPNHKDFRKIKIKSIDDFEFDPRLTRK